MSIVIAAGGTGGHLIPAIVTAKEIIKKKPSVDVVFIGAGKKIESEILSETDFRYEVLAGAPVLGKGLSAIYFLLFRFVPLLFKARSLIRKLDARVVIGFGGYPSVLPVVAAWSLGIPSVIFEQNGKAGFANKFLAKIAKKIFAVPGVEGLASSEINYITNPVRPEIRKVKKWTPSGGRINILVLGGSQGAVRLNDAICSFMESGANLPVSLIHQTGKKDFERIKNFYNSNKIEALVKPYFTNMEELYEKSDLVISRAGASTVSEILTVRRAAIFIPLAISNAHQSYNCKELVNYGVAWVIPQDEALDENLELLIKKICENPEMIEETVNAYDSFYSSFNFKDGADALSDCLISYEGR